MENRTRFDATPKTKFLYFFLITFISFLIALWIMINKIRFPQMVVSGWASLILMVLFMGGIQLLSLGILGLYLGRQYREVKKRPLYIVSDKFGFARDSCDPKSDGERSRIS